MPESPLLHIPSLILSGNGFLSLEISYYLTLDFTGLQTPISLCWIKRMVHAKCCNAPHDWQMPTKQSSSASHFYRGSCRDPETHSNLPKVPKQVQGRARLDSNASGLNLASLPETCNRIKWREYGLCSTQVIQDGASILPWGFTTFI